MDLETSGLSIQVFIGGVSTIVLTIIGAVKYFFNVKSDLQKELHAIDSEYKKSINCMEREYKERVHSLELKIKELEHKDQMQQSILDGFPNVFSIINRVFDKKEGENGSK